MFVVLAILIGLSAIRQASHPLTLIFTAFFLALALNAPVHWIAQRLPGKRKGSRTAATGISFLVVIVLLIGFSLQFAGAAYDKLSRGRIHPLFLWVPLLVIVETVGLFAFVMPSAGWHRLAMWLIG